MITKEQFKSYENVRISGITNMYAINTVQKLSGLTRKQCIEIMKNYTELKEKYLTGK